MLSYTLVRKKKKATKVAMKNLRQKKAAQTLFNGLTDSAKLMLNNFPFVMARPEISETMQLPRISLIYLSTMLTLTKSSDSPLRTLVRKGIQRSQQLKWKFQRILGWTFSLESMNFLSWQCTGILTSLLEWKASRKRSQNTASWLGGNIYILLTQPQKIEKISSAKFAHL